MGSNPVKLQRPYSEDKTAAGSDEYSTSLNPEQNEFVCTTCARSYQQVSASIYCKSCRDHLCFRCLQWHGKYRDKHVDDLIGQYEMRKLGVQWSQLMPTEKCLDHGDKLWNMFCLKDDIAGCQQCMDEKHRTCDGVIPRSSQEIEVANGQLKISNDSKDMVSTPNDGQVGGQLMQNVYDDGQVDGRKFNSKDLQVNGKFKIPGQSQNNDQVSGSRKMDILSGQTLSIDDGQVSGDKFTQRSSNDDKVDGKKSKPDFFSDDFQVDGKSKHSEHRQNDDQVDGLNIMNTESIQPSKSDTDYGQVSGTSMTDEKELLRYEDNCQVSGTRSLNIGLYSVKSNSEVNVRLKSDRYDSCICDMAVLSDGRLLISDFKNKKIKLLNSNHSIVHQCGVLYDPVGICMINDTDAAVTMADGHIQFVSVEEKIKLGRRLKLDHSCCGVTYSDGELYLSDTQTSVHVCTLAGKKLRTFNTVMSDEQRSRLEWLTVSKDGIRIYMTNNEYGIVCLDRMSGEVIWKVKDTEEIGYAGVCVDRYNNVFVCRFRKNDVVQFSPSGQLTGVVIDESEGLRYPWSISIDETRNRLVVGMEDDDVIKVFTFQS